jgi:integrase
MIPTGAIYSEIAALQWKFIGDKKIYIRQSYNPQTGTITPIAKTKSRYRDIVITDALRCVLNEINGCDKPDPNSFVFKSPGDLVLGYTKLHTSWDRAVHLAQLEPLSMYCLRHTFIAWCLTIGMELIRVVALAGHSSRKMVDENYGRYIPELEKDEVKIRAFFGKDFHNETKVKF